ncbi:hypothetical protein B0T14DRAFT_517387 [Immersiella caudata]|uniref:Methyltransferase n=1 Tax=Immersiella caudata TaxID=314043 RepID=A0AA40C3S9_9PEZI|nr:hypothetical protein B0T14DRAFT_517387 [Immersiella caudata]
MINDISATLEFLEDLELYKTERPYILTPHGHGLDHLGDSKNGQSLNTVRLINGEVVVRDIRGLGQDKFTLQDAGFGIVNNETRNKTLDFMSEEARKDYGRETEEFWKKELEAEYVLTYNVRLRRNGYWDPNEPVDVAARGWIDPPAKGIHVDLTFEQAPILVSNHLTEQSKTEYLAPGYRYRIVNTWRPLIPFIEDNPLAVCDTRTIEPSDLVLTDRIFPNNEYTLYLVKHSQKQRWHWLSKQTPSELTLMMMYDSKPGAARFCAHGSFVNPLAPKDAVPRRSIETRSLVVTKE